MNRARRPLDERGIVFVEFLISFIPFFLIFLGTIQLALIFTADIVAQHAAVTAARTAILTIDDDPCFHEGEERKLLPIGPNRASDGLVQRALDKLKISKFTGPKISGAGQRGGSRLDRVRNAAYLPLASVSPSRKEVAAMLPWATTVAEELAGYDVARAIGDEPAFRTITGFGAYNRVASAVTFPEEPGGEDLRDPDADAWEDEDTITVRVTYLFPCAVPIVRSFACDSLITLFGAPQLAEAYRDIQSAPSLAEAKARAESVYKKAVSGFKKGKQLLYELRRAEAFLFLPALASPRNKFVVLRREATLPNQGAPYLYPSELGVAKCKGMTKKGES